MPNKRRSLVPYSIRAFHEWCTDNGDAPYIVVHVDKNTTVPMDYVNAENNEIVLNTSYAATRDLKIENDFITFSARFNGKSENIVVPVGNVVTIFSRETGEGMSFDITLPIDAFDQTPPVVNKPKLTIVK